ncbi:MAG TPA: MogA/MoaB family molybdenum cofactor biosynthesis protein [Candidatus Methylacidiphilales bacterium]|nr:MogA/MoaB family molybdenum cofactor biosynthesis protein [Candidatus Methylacidiphilales bacterium]
MKIGRITFADPAAPSNQQFGPEIDKVLTEFFDGTHEVISILAGDSDQVRAALLRLCDEEKCPLVVTTGGTGPNPGDFMPDATRSVLDRELPGFGEIMRAYSFERVKVSILSRASAGVRGRSFIINLPSRPKAVKFCLGIVRDGLVDVLDQVAGVQVTLRRDEIVVPLEKYLPFLKFLRVKPNPQGEHPSIS